MTLGVLELVLLLIVAVLGLAVLFGVVFFAILAAQRKRNQVRIAPVLEPQTQDQPPEASPPPSPRAENPPMKYAFDFTDDTLTMILEMPTTLLEDDEALAEGWVNVVSWARVTYRDILEKRLAEGHAATDADASAEGEPELSGEALEASLKRLHDSAERRRELRMLLSKK
ncbi:MAG TPA: hypothetical protein ENK60_08880 [Anaerolineae bacterium]|nr:hypothetical protein [Anaerolineae bacterium]